MKNSKVRKVLLIITIIILIISAVIGVAVSTGFINAILSSDGKTIIDGADFTIFANLIGTLGAVAIGIVPIVIGFMTAGVIWLTYGIILGVSLLIKREKSKKIIVWVVIGILLVIALFVAGNYFRSKSLAKANTIGSIAYNCNKNQYIVYVKEMEKYCPYLVLCNDYDHTGNSLLLRENILNEPKVQMNNERYDESYVDTYLSEKFIYVFDDKLIQKINDTELRFSQKINNIKKVYTINRKFFILSNSEIGYDYFEDNAKSKTVLHYFKNNENYIAYNDENIILPWWTRTSDYYSFGAVGYNGVLMNGVTSNEGCGIRPAFTISSDTKIKKEYNKEFNEEIFVLDI